MVPSTDISELRRTVGEYAGQHATLFMAARARSPRWRWCVLAMQGIAGPMLKPMHNQFGYLIGLLSSVRS